MPVLKKLDTLWNKAQCNKKWKIQILNAVIMSRLTYGLETIEPTEGALTTLTPSTSRGSENIANENHICGQSKHKRSRVPKGFPSASN
jgi:hypothetical protein